MTLDLDPDSMGVELVEQALLNGELDLGYREPIQCRHCSQDDLFWVKTKDGWRLFNEDGIHHCPAFAKKQNNFKPVSNGFANLFKPF